MSKRMTDTGKWSDPWFSDLPQDYKLVWLYLFDNCNNSGVWVVNKRLVEFSLGATIKWNGFLKASEGRLIEFDGGAKWFFPKFISFHYGQLKESNRFHRSILEDLKLNNLIKYLNCFNNSNNNNSSQTYPQPVDNSVDNLWITQDGIPLVRGIDTPSIPHPRGIDSGGDFFQCSKERAYSNNIIYNINNINNNNKLDIRGVEGYGEKGSGSFNLEPCESKKSKSTKWVPDNMFWDKLKANPAYKHVNFDIEIGRMSAWLELPKNKGRRLSRQFVLNWLNRQDHPLSQMPPMASKALPPSETCSAGDCFRRWTHTEENKKYCVNHYLEYLEANKNASGLKVIQKDMPGDGFEKISQCG